MGSSEPSTMNMSLDEMIASRRKENRRSGGRRFGEIEDPYKVSNVDRSIATSRAKRNAVMRKRRGLSDSAKASQTEIEQEVQKQAQQTLMEKAKKAQHDKKRVTSNAKLDPSERAEIRNERRKLARAAAKAKKEQLAGKGGGAAKSSVPLAKVAETAPLGRPPSKRAVKAAVSAMEEKGFSIPEGYQMVITFAPTNNAVAADPNQKPGPKRNQPKTGGGGPVKQGWKN